MKSLGTILVLLGLCIGAAPSAKASPCVDSSTTTCFSNGHSGGSTLGDLGNSLTFGSITATAWATDDPSSNKFRVAALEQYDTFGLGVCSQIEIAPCVSPAHAVSNELGSSGIFDFVLLRFSQPVTAVSFVLNPFLQTNQEMDYTYFAGNCAPNAASCSPNGQTLLNLSAVSGFGGKLTSTTVSGINGGCCSTSVVTANLNLGLNSGGVNWILIGASTSSPFDDAFKLDRVNYTSAVPEPATLGLAGAALTAMGLFRRKKRSASV